MRSVAVISIFDGTRPGTHDPSEELAQHFPRLYVAPVVVDSTRRGSDPRAFHAHTLQVMTPGVLGCALAHRKAASRLLESEHGWAIILEDDAMVDDPGILADRAHRLAHLVDAEAPMLLLFCWDPSYSFRTGESGPIDGTSRCRYTPISAVAYLLNRGAARLIVERQSPVKYNADWPLLASDGLIMVDSARPVRHRNLPSLIDAAGRRSGEMPPLWRLRILSLAWYLQYRRHFTGLSQYLEMVVGPRVDRWLDRRRAR